MMLMMMNPDFATYTFPFRLYHMLEEASKAGFEEIVSWLPDGNAFVVHNREKFTDCVMKKFFSHTKWKSFLRQLNLYNFQRLSKRGPGHGSCYAHPFLIRGEIEKCNQIQRSSHMMGAASSSRVSADTSRTRKNKDTVASSSHDLAEGFLVQEPSPLNVQCFEDPGVVSKPPDSLQEGISTVKNIASMMFMGDDFGESHHDESSSLICDTFLPRGSQSRRQAEGGFDIEHRWGLHDTNYADYEDTKPLGKNAIEVTESLQLHRKSCSPDPIGDEITCTKFWEVGKDQKSFNQDMADAIVSLFLASPRNSNTGQN